MTFIEYTAWAALIVAVGSLVVSYLVHADAVRRDAKVEQRVVERENANRTADARDRAIARVVDHYHLLRRETGAGANLRTLRDAGIAELRTDADMREAIERMARAGPDPLQHYRKLISSLDLVKVFDHSIANDCPPDRSIEAVYRETFGRET